MAAFDSPWFAFTFGLIIQVAAAYFGDRLRHKLRAFWKEERPDFDVLRTAALTLLGLLIGFSFARLLADMISAKTWRKQRQMP